jgi:hypothetical protein
MYAGIKSPDRALLQGAGKRRVLHLHHISGDRRFDLFELVRRDGRAVGIAHLEPVVGSGVVRGGDVDAAAGFFKTNRVGDGRGGGGPVGEEDGKTVAGEHLGGGGGEMLRVETPVVADYNLPPAQSAAQKIIGESLSAPFDVGEGVILGDPSPPAVGSKANDVHGVRSRSARMEERRIIPPGILRISTVSRRCRLKRVNDGLRGNLPMAAGS